MNRVEELASQAEASRFYRAKKSPYHKLNFSRQCFERLGKRLLHCSKDVSQGLLNIIRRIVAYFFDSFDFFGFFDFL